MSLSASAELLVIFGPFGFKLPIHANFWVVLGDMTGKQQQKFCMVIKLDVRKEYTRLITDARSVCGIANLLVYLAKGLSSVF